MTAPANAEDPNHAGWLPANVETEVRALARLRSLPLKAARDLVFAASLDTDRRARASAARAADATVPPSPLDSLEAYIARDAVRSLLRDGRERARFGEVLDELRAEAATTTDEPTANPWEGRRGWAEEMLLPVAEKHVESEDGKTAQVPKEPAIVEYNHLIRDLHYRPFRTLDGQSRVAIPGTYGLEVHDPRGAKFVDLLSYRGYTLRGEPTPRAALFRTAIMLDQRALDRSLPAERIVDLRLRVAPIEGGSLLDLHDPRSRCVRVTADGWRIETIGYPVFESPANMLPLPDPTPPQGAPSGRVPLPRLWRFLTPAPGDSPLRIRLLVAALLVQPLVDPDLPRPILVVLGPEGSGKSQQSAAVQALIDPSVTETLDPPKTEEILADELRVRNTLNLDNVSSIPTWLSDSICRASGGGGLAKRALYTDKGEVLSRAVRSVILNGITAEPRRPDLLRRCVFFAVDPETRKIDPQRLRREWRDAHPAVLSSLLDLAAAVLRIRRDSPPPSSDDSMAGFVEIGRAVAIAHGLDPSEFDAAWAEMVAEQGSIAAEDPWTAALADALKQAPEGKEVTAAQLARWITENHADLFPRGVRAEELGHRIRRVERTLQTRGVAVRRRHTRVGATYSWTKVPESTVTPSPSGQTTLEPLTGSSGSALGDGSRDGSVTVAPNHHGPGDGVTVVMGDGKPPTLASGEPPAGPVMEEPGNWAVPAGARASPEPSMAPSQADDPTPVDPARSEAATRELTDLLRSTGTASREAIRHILSASGFMESEISAAIGALAASGLVRQEPDGALRWKEASA